MDKTIRLNEICVIGLPRCDFVFSSTRTCFVAYEFNESNLEMSILRNLLKDRGIQIEEAGGALAPAQSAFCAKICSKIITSQFCVVLINNKVSGKLEIPNANVNMEYGLMLGFNKYVIPFQRESQKLPFNVAGLDTVKYTNANFESLAGKAIDQAISETQQDTSPPFSPDQILDVFLLTKKALITPLNTVVDNNLFQLGRPLGFNLLNDFSGLNYMYLGNFSALRSEVVIWRIKMLTEILDSRHESFDKRVQLGLVTEEESHFLSDFLDQLQIWIIVTTKEDVDRVSKDLSFSRYKVEVFSISDVQSELKMLGDAHAEQAYDADNLKQEA